MNDSDSSSRVAVLGGGVTGLNGAGDLDGSRGFVGLSGIRRERERESGQRCETLFENHASFPSILPGTRARFMQILLRWSEPPAVSRIGVVRCKILIKQPRRSNPATNRLRDAPSR